MVEGKRHEKGVDRVKNILESVGAEIVRNDSGPHGKGGYKFPPMKIAWLNAEFWTPIIDVIADVPAATKLADTKQRIGVMVNGMHSGGGHSSSHAVHYDRQYYQEFGKTYGLWITPFTTDELIGRKAISDIRILEEIAYTLRERKIRSL